MLGSAQSEAGICSPAERGVLLPRRWIQATTVGSWLPLTKVHLVGSWECDMRLGGTWLVWVLLTNVPCGCDLTTESGGAHTAPSQP